MIVQDEMKELGENIAAVKSMGFAIRRVSLNRFLRQGKGGYDLSRQLLRCGRIIMNRESSIMNYTL